MNKTVTLLLAALLCGVPTVLRGQDASPLPKAGSYGLSFGLPNGGGAGFGLRQMRSGRKSLGVALQFGVGWQQRSDSIQGDFSSTGLSVGARPDLRLYRRVSGPVVPFIGVDAQFTYQRSSNFDWALSGGMGVGLGAEWFPSPGISISGWSGAAARYRHIDTRDGSENGLNVGDFRSELTFNLYF